MSESAGHDVTFTLLDGVALVVAAAVASVHMKTAVQSATGVGWVLVWLAFAGVGVTAAGPMLYVARRFGRTLPSYPRLGDRLWGLLGSPWVATAPLRTSRAVGYPRPFELYGLTLTVTVALTCLIVMAVLWKTFVFAPLTDRRAVRGPTSWTDRLGMLVSVAWPFQCGYLLLVLDSEIKPLLD